MATHGSIDNTGLLSPNAVTEKVAVLIDTHKGALTNDKVVIIRKTETDFVTRWKTLSDNQTITIPAYTEVDDPFNGTITWHSVDDDSIISTDTFDAVDSASFTTSLPTAGEYICRISGVFSSIKLRNSGDEDKLIEVLNLGNVGWTTFANSFRSCPFLKEFTVGNMTTNNTKDLFSIEYMLPFNNNLTFVDFNGFNLPDSANGIDATYWMAGTNIYELDLSMVDMKNVTSLQWAFANINNCTHYDVNNWDVSRVTDMQGTFSGCLSTILDVSDWDTSNVTDMSYMFEACYNIISLDLSSWDVGNVTTMSNMFYYNAMLYSLDVSTWNTSSVTNMARLFNDCESLPTVDVSTWNTSSVTDMVSMFDGCKNIHTLDVSDWDTTLVSDIGSMFESCRKLQSIDVSEWETGNVQTMAKCFYSCYVLPSIDVSGWDTSSATTFAYMFQSCNLLSVLDVSNFDTSSCTSFNNMFSRCKNLITIDVSGFDTTACSGEYVNSMFSYCWSLESVDMSNFDTSSCTSLRGLFSNCHSLTSIIGVGDLAVNNIRSLRETFFSCRSLTTLDLSSWGISLVTDMSYTFAGCITLTSLDISGWTTTLMTTCRVTFWRCSVLTHIEGFEGFTFESISSNDAQASQFINETPLSPSDYGVFLDNVLNTWPRLSWNYRIDAPLCGYNASSSATHHTLTHDKTWIITDLGLIS